MKKYKKKTKALHILHFQIVTSVWNYIKGLYSHLLHVKITVSKNEQLYFHSTFKRIKVSPKI